MATFFGSDILDDRLEGGVSDDTMYGGADGGTGGGNDVLRGGPGNDVSYGGIGGDKYFGGAGDDAMFASAEDLVVSGGPGSDRAVFGAGPDVVDGSRLALVELVELGDGDDTFGPGTPAPTAPTSIALSALGGANGFEFAGGDANDRVGQAVTMGDVNGDGLDDIAFLAPGAGAGNVGGVYVRFGSATTPAAIGPSAFDGAAGFFLEGAVGSNAALAMGDVNGDGLLDLLVGVQEADFNGTNSGSVFGLFGSTGPFASTIDLAGLPGAGGFRIDGQAANHRAGGSVGAADLDGDGDDDLILGATGATFGGAGSGSAYINLGDISTATVTVALDSSNSYRLDGAAGFGLGSSLAPLDFDGDGDLELALGARLASGARGSTFVLDPIDLNPAWISTATIVAPLEGTSAFRLNGGAGNDQSGLPVANAGDVNGDGRDDLLIAANQVSNARGAVYVVFGTAGGIPVTTVSLSTLDGNNGFRIDGAATFDGLGSAASAAGDVNGDGYADILVSASFADPNGASSGATWLLFGKASGFGPVLSLSSLAAGDGVRLAGAAANDRSGFAVAGGGDVNGDGLDDVAIGAPQSDPAAAAEAGRGYVVFGDRWASPEADAPLVTVLGEGGRDVLTGDDGAQALYGGDDNDLLYGGGSNDELYGGAGTNKAHGGDGDDKVDAGVGNGSSAVGGAGTDVLSGDYSGLLAGVTMIGAGTSGRIVSGATTIHFSQIEVRDIVGSDFDDLLRGGALGDRLDCGAGDDECHGWLGDDAMYGGIGNDVQHGGDGNDGIYSGLGDDSSYGGNGNDLFDCGEGDDFSNCGLGDDAGYGGAGNDVQHGGGGNDGLFGGTGNDTQYGGDGNDLLDPGTGSGLVKGGNGVDTLQIDYNALGRAVIVLGSGASGSVVTDESTVTFAEIEHRALGGGALNDLLRGGAGNDLLYGFDGDDQLHGGGGDDFLHGGNGSNRLFGGEGNDTLLGGGDDDLLQGGPGDDRVFGGGGNDIFRKGPGEGNDRIIDNGVEPLSVRIHLIGGLDVVGGLGTNVVVLSDGSTITGPPEHHWSPLHFV